MRCSLWTSAVVAVGLAAVHATARPRGQKLGAQAGKAVYLITNDADNAVVALPVAADGTLSKGSVTPTGGKGANSIDAMTNQPAGPDALASQGSLTVAGQNLFAVNPGSNSLTMFSISESDPTELTMVGQPIVVPAEFPTTVGASIKNQVVCVGSTGATAGVSCSSFCSESGLGPMDALRPFDLGQTTPPVGPTNTVSHVFFSGDEETLFTTVKGDPDKNNTGFLAAFPVTRDGGRPGAAAAVVSRDAKTSSPQVLAVDGPTGAATVKGKGVVDGQMATCWSTVSSASGSAFVTDVGINRLVEMSTADASIQGVIDLSANGDPGLTDLRAAGNFIYALSPGNGTTKAAVTVVDALSKRQVQHFDLGALGVGKNAQGIAVL